MLVEQAGGGQHRLADGGIVIDLSQMRAAHIVPAARRVNTAAPFASGGVYVNFMTAAEGDRVRVTYGGNYVRLNRVKQPYDPGNLFRTSQNISPAQETKTRLTSDRAQDPQVSS